MSSLPPPPPGARNLPAPSGPSTRTGLAQRLGPLPVWLWLVVAVALGSGSTALALRGGDSSSDQLPSRTTVELETTTTHVASTTAAPPATIEPAPTAPETTPGTTPAAGTTLPPATAPPATTTTTSTLPYDLVVTEHWYFPSGDDMYDYGGLIENRGTQTATGFISVDVDFYDATGRILSAETAFVDMVVPGAPTPFASFLIDPVAEPVRMEVRISDDIFIDPAPGPEGTLTASNVDMVDAGGFVDITGDATSTFEVDLDYVQLVALWRDDGGAIEFAASGYLERLPAGATGAFTISSFAEYVPPTPPTEILVAP